LVVVVIGGLAIRVRRRRVGAVDHCGGHAARGVDRDDSAEAGELIMYLRRRGRPAVLCRVVVAGRAPREVATRSLGSDPMEGCASCVTG
jgi:hypothetical protein